VGYARAIIVPSGQAGRASDYEREAEQSECQKDVHGQSGSVLRDAPKFLRELQLRELLLQGHARADEVIE
jgi:hypothetical protein